MSFKLFNLVMKQVIIDNKVEKILSLFQKHLNRRQYQLSRKTHIEKQKLYVTHDRNMEIGQLELK